MTTKNIKLVCHSNILSSREGHIPKCDAIAVIKRQSLFFAMAIVALVYAANGIRPAGAQSITGIGDVNPGPVLTPNWVVGDEISVGDTGVGTLTILDGGTASSTSGVIGYTGGSGTVTVSGSDINGNVSTWTNVGGLHVGWGGSASLSILDGGLVSNEIGNIGRDSTGTATVSGVDSHGNASIWLNTSDLYIGNGGTGSLLIQDGGVVRNVAGVIGDTNGGAGPGAGTVTVSGSDGNGRVSTWINSTNLYVGMRDAGTLIVQDGAAVSSMTGYLGYFVGANGTATVSGNDGHGNVSTWTIARELAVGVNDTGALTIENGGRVRARDTLIAMNGGSTGTLDLIGNASERGVLETGSVIKGSGTAIFNIDGGILRATRNEANFLNGFGALAVGTEGAWFDINGHNIGVSTAFSGTSSFNKLGLGTLTLTGNSSAFIGSTEVQAGTLQVDGILGGPANVFSGARLTGIGRIGSTINRGVVAPGHSGSLGTLTIAGNYTPLGGSLEVRTQLGDDGSPTDRLVITGSTSGTTPVKVTNFGGAGAQTVEGIKIIDVAGASNGAFSLLGTTTYDGDQAVVAGAYAYRLYQGGASTPGDGDWYLRSALQGPSASPATPLYQPGVPSYEAYPQFLLGLNGLPTLQQRVGNRFWNNRNATPPEENGVGAAGAFTDSKGMWVRLEGGHTRISPEYSTSDSDYEYDMAKMQIGLDALLSQYSGGKLVGGLSVHYVHGTADTTWRRGIGRYGSGDISTDGYGLGGSLTWYGENGFYIDGTTQVTWYNTDLSANPVRGLKDSNNAFGHAWSLEGGKRIAISNDWSITPQLQMTYSKARFKDFNDVFGASVRSGRDDSLQARLGVSLERQINRTHLYGIANLYNEFFNGTSVAVGNKTFASRKDRLWAGVGFGGSYNWDNDKYSIYGEGTFNTSLAGGDSHGYAGTIGIRVRW